MYGGNSHAVRLDRLSSMTANISLQATTCKLRLQVPSRPCRSAAPELNRWVSFHNRGGKLESV
jgi:hypothetical protein